KLSVTGIGRRNAEFIFARALTHYLFPLAQFYDVRTATVQAAADFFGSSSAEQRATESAWDAVGVTNPQLFFYSMNDGSAAAVAIGNNGQLSVTRPYSSGSFSA